MEKNVPSKALIGLVFGTLLVTACDWKVKPSFPADQIAPSMQTILKRDYQLKAASRHAGSSLQTFVWRVGLLSRKDQDLSREAGEVLQNILLTATRVALSTDAPLDFIEVKMADVLTGTTITLWRYVPDIRDSMYQRIGDEEYYNRLVMEIDNEMEPLQNSEEEVWNAPLTLPEFLAKQVVFRLKRHSALSTLQLHEDLSKPRELAMVIDNWDDVSEEGGVHPDEVSTEVEKTVQAVIKSYRFKGFQGLVLKDGRGVPLKRWTL